MPDDYTRVRKQSNPGIKIDPTLVDQDLLIHEVVAMFGSNPKLIPLMAELAERSKGLSDAGNRVGTLKAKVLPDGELEIRFVSRWPIMKGSGVK